MADAGYDLRLPFDTDDPQFKRGVVIATWPAGSTAGTAGTAVTATA